MVPVRCGHCELNLRAYALTQRRAGALTRSLIVALLHMAGVSCVALVQAGRSRNGCWHGPRHRLELGQDGQLLW